MTNEKRVLSPVANQKAGMLSSQPMRGLDTRRYQACNAARQPLTYEQLITKQNGQNLLITDILQNGPRATGDTVKQKFFVI